VIPFAFVSRHQPTPEQFALSREKGIDLVPVGDLDAFTVEVHHILERLPEAEGVVVVHPAAAMRLSWYFLVGVFENANRAPEGAPPSFQAVALHLFNRRA